MKNTHFVQILKAVIPFLDVSAGETIDLEGMFRAVRPLIYGKERRLIDMLLQFFQMKHMMEMMQFMQAMQEFQQAQGTEDDGASGMTGGADPWEMIRAMVPPEQQDTVEMMMSMMAAMQDSAEQGDSTVSAGTGE